MSSPIVLSVVKLNCREHRTLTTVSFMKLNPQDHQALESGLNTLHVTRLGRKKVHKLGLVLRPAPGRVQSGPFRGKACKLVAAHACGLISDM
jgi:hypothetical protein